MSTENPNLSGPADARRLAKTATRGVYRRHAAGCSGRGRCTCPYLVTWRDRGAQRRREFASYDLAREFKSQLGSGGASRRQHSAAMLADYYARWLPGYRGRTARGLDEDTRREYEMSFRLHVLPLPIARLRLREVAAPDVRDWLSEVERRGASPATVRKAKAALSVLFASALQDGDIGSNPVAGVRYVPSAKAKAKHPKRQRRALGPDDVRDILAAMDERWRAFFLLLTQTGLRVGEAIALRWGHVHLGDDPHVDVVEQIRRGQRKRLKTDASHGRVPLSPAMAQWLSELRPADVLGDAPVFPSKTGTPLSYANVYHRVLRPALVEAGIARQVGERTVKVRRGGETVEEKRPVYDYEGVGFHAFRKACGSLLLHHGKTLKQVQGWLRHSQLTTTMNVYINQVDDGLGGAEVWGEIIPGRG